MEDSIKEFRRFNEIINGRAQKMINNGTLNV